MTAGRYSDNEIIQLIKNGGDDYNFGLRHLYLLYRERLVRYIFSRIRDESEAENIYHTVIINAVENIAANKFNEDSSLSTYLFAIARNLCRKLFTRQGRHQQLAELDLEEEESNDVPDVKIIEEELEMAVNQIMAILNENERQVLLLHFRSYSMKEIAEKLGYKNEPVVRNIKRRAMKKLTDRFGNDPDLRKLLE